MATKTISLELDAYEKLRRAKRSDRESFSSVVRRAHFPHETRTAEQVLSALRELGRTHPESLLDEETLHRLSERAGSRTSRARP
jgi:predicted CopG family antitoxin